MKQTIRDHIAAGDLDAALAQLRIAAAALAAPPDLADEITVLEKRHAKNSRQARLKTRDPEAVDREDNSLADAVLELLRRLPDAPPLPTGRPTAGIGEQAMKQHILLLTVGVKAVVVLWLFTHWESRGFSDDQFTGTLTLLLPVLAAYAGLMFQDFLDHRHQPDELASRHGPRIRRSVQWAIYAVILGYGLALVLAIGAKARGTLSYAQLAGAIALIESGLGVYLARIVRTFFPGGEGR
ncbi:MAG: hypothetical protein ABMA02_01440 [Saprospiraceae bacterium]